LSVAGGTSSPGVTGGAVSSLLALKINFQKKFAPKNLFFFCKNRIFCQKIEINFTSHLMVAG